MNYYQQGGPVQNQSQEDKLREQIAKIVEASLNGDSEATKQLQQVVDEAKKGDPNAQKIAVIIKEIMETVMAQKMQMGGAMRSKLGYIRKLRTGVGPDEEVIYQKCGGKITKKVVRKAKKAKK